jgi:hypothetical protein
MLVAIAGAGLVAGVWTGLVRAGWVLPSGGVIAPPTHGLLMVSGFFGALISLERAAALDRGWWLAVAVLADRRRRLVA